MRTLASLVALLLVSIVTPGLAAPVVYSDPLASPPNLASGSNWDPSSSTQQTASVFTLSSTSEIKGINWWGGFNALSGSDSPVTTPNPFIIRFFDVVGGNTIAVNPFFEVNLLPAAVSTGLTSPFPQVDEIFYFTAELSGSGPVLVSGQQYAISILMDRTQGPLASFPANDFANWQRTNSTGLAANRTSGDGTAWNTNNVQYAFELEGLAAAETGVPTPGAGMLMLLGLMGLVVRKRGDRT